MQPSHPNHPCEPFTRVQKLKRKVPISMSTDMSEMVRMSIDYSLKKAGNRAKLYISALEIVPQPLALQHKMDAEGTDCCYQ